MSRRTGQNDASSVARSARRGWIHFVVAAGILLIAATGWNGAMTLLKWTMVKYPVPWPEGLEVQQHQLINFPEYLGPFVVARDGELFHKKDGQPDGIRTADDDTLEGLGTSAHELNWYYMAFYRDTRTGGAEDGGPKRYIQLDITYYTGLLDAVPHVPLRCLPAAGYNILHDRSGPMLFSADSSGAGADIPALWREFTLHRTVGMKDQSYAVEYFVFSMNGLPTSRWEMVRGKLTLPWVKYCYFAKIQLAVRKETTPGKNKGLVYETDLDASDALCRDFLNYALPEVLQFLPSADDVKKMEEK